MKDLYIYRFLILLSCLCIHNISDAQCDCTEYIYLNEVSNGGSVHKFDVSTDGSLTEILNGGNTWYPGSGVSEMSSPHGLVSDLNGFLYIGETAFGDIRRLDCDANLFSESGASNAFVINRGTWNMVSYQNTLYLYNYDIPAVQAYDLCDGTLLGSYDLSNDSGSSWGMTIHESTIYIADSWRNDSNEIYKFDVLTTPYGSVITPLISANGPVSTGSSNLPISALNGIAIDLDGNIYVVNNDRFNQESVPQGSGRILKYSPSGVLLAMSPWDIEQGNTYPGETDNDNRGFFDAIGIIYSETSDRLFVSTSSPTDDCVALFDTDLNYLGAAVPFTNNTSVAKGIAINKECCPTPRTQTIDQVYCEATLGDQIFLNEIFPCDGVVCGAAWVPDPGNTGITYDDCDQSIVINSASTCASFTKMGSNAQCGTYNLTYNVEIFTPGDITVLGDQTVCGTETPNTISVTSSSSNIQWQSSTTSCNDGFTDIAGATSSTYTPSAITETTYYRAVVTETGTCSSGNCQLTSDCVTVTYDANCPTGNCSCTEYIYLNEPFAGSVHKLQVQSDGTLSEIFGGANNDRPWYPGDNSTELPSPHGLGTDINGFLYISTTGSPGGSIRKLTCDGEIFPASEFAIIHPSLAQNIFSIGNTIYNNSNGGPTGRDICTQESIGQVCLNNAGGTNLWGLHYNPVTEMFYATSRGGGNEVWVWTMEEHEQSLAGNLCIDPLLDINPAFDLFGIVSSNNGAFYVISSNLGDGSYIYKFDQNGNQLGVVGPSGPTIPWGSFIGITFSEEQQMLYTSNYTGSPTKDCISMFDTDLNYVGTGFPNPPNGGGSQSKAIGIVKECCPNQTLLELDATVCSKGNGEVVFLQELFDCGDGLLCEGMWSVESANTNQTFNDCSLSIEINGSGCGTYVLEKTTPASGAQQCDAFRIELEVCTEVPEVTLTPAEGTCTDGTPNNDGSIDISGVSNADQTGISIGNTYSGPDYGGATNLDLSSVSGSFENLMHGTEYTVRIFNGSNDCFVDQTITTSTIQCAPVCEIDAISMTSNQCVDNATPENPSDDRVQVGIFVSGTGSTFTLSVDGGTTITPSSGTIGSPGFFMLGLGTAGSGNTYTITVEDATEPSCNQTLVVQAPENCDSVFPCPTKDCGGITIQKNE